MTNPFRWVKICYDRLNTLNTLILLGKMIKFPGQDKLFFRSITSF